MRIEQRLFCFSQMLLEVNRTLAYLSPGEKVQQSGPQFICRARYRDLRCSWRRRIFLKLLVSFHKFIWWLRLTKRGGFGNSFLGLGPFRLGKLMIMRLYGHYAGLLPGRR